MDEVLKIKELRVSFKQRYGNLDAVRGVSLSVRKGEILALVGESGCGKSVTAKSVLKLNDVSGGDMTAEELWLGGRDILAASEREMLEIRGKLAGMIFQDPLTYLNPTMKVGKQVTETLRRHGKKRLLSVGQKRFGCWKWYRYRKHPCVQSSIHISFQEECVREP